MSLLIGALPSTSVVHICEGLSQGRHQIVVAGRRRDNNEDCYRGWWAHEAYPANILVEEVYSQETAASTVGFPISLRYSSSNGNDYSTSYAATNYGRFTGVHKEYAESRWLITWTDVIRE